jgi:hypothetical protein
LEYTNSQNHLLVGKSKTWSFYNYINRYDTPKSDTGNVLFIAEDNEASMKTDIYYFKSNIGLISRKYSLIQFGGETWSQTSEKIDASLISSNLLNSYSYTTQRPDKYQLSQNYPNPFNPSTTITYTVPEQSNVRLSIFNTLGQRISEIVNETKDEGSYEESFNASQLSSGIYFYRIEATSVNNSKTFVETKKMLLIR